MRAFFEAMFFAPKWHHRIVSFVLLPLSWVYGAGMWLRRQCVKRKSFDIPIISVGNLIVGGSGKTPFVIALASRYEDVVVISRGYGRQSRGLVQVSQKGEIRTDVTQSGDEAMLMALSLPHADVIVSENRVTAIDLAKKKGARLIVLDDGFNRVTIDKFEILLQPQTIPNHHAFPAGPFREFVSQKKVADLVVTEGKEFIREVSFEDLSEKMLLVTAISNPKRLDVYLPEGVVGKVYLEDHAYFDESVLQALLKSHGATHILCTTKDKVKMIGFKLPIAEMKLKLALKNEIFTQIDEYIKGYRYEK
ncbi:MAG TPA: tetraacyldisaccharide 4'-kinase [Sulfurovum sp.]|jgi:tetraacyldisaccharide 4'-kinase|nr:MAG: tetraacyldisaccharide 4'-kinase [Sulfurovum sp. 35-42-20]OYZ24861.1 MAG: tetraacyldisaccharide 4'-kinase [Sulfurovum sp. 16-42-52]OYZ50356.1 MAG: tetraacyldisaccharide 4'-kinase [Sulfurovum sp. 24-42-9]OZA44583.1 MAG: tetraacyldisaccharide 4'-kinase [Sulfurovum sp. 17-42-90]OZA60793.1 MAG: tetraacyldisaccharide 4'-kinase [Sulfurovum sp. 39-42-12]HQR74528.1 tetraacyldisaccharide 4'-kinase [Sulfurovum sp.]